MCSRERASLEWRVFYRNALTNYREYPFIVRTILVTIHDRGLRRASVMPVETGLRRLPATTPRPSGVPAVGLRCAPTTVPCAIFWAAGR